MKQKNKKPRFGKLLTITLVAFIIFPVSLMSFVYTFGISRITLPIAISAMFLLAVIKMLVKKYQKGRGFIYVGRGIVVSAWIAFYIPTLLMFNFSHNRFLYPLKRFDYIYSSYIDGDYYKQILPPKLPPKCDDYSFHTQGSIPAPEHHPSSYLAFHTDTATLDSYANYFDKLDGERLENGEDEAIQRKIEDFYELINRRELLQDNIDHAVLYLFDSSTTVGVLLNYETGLIAIIT